MRRLLVILISCTLGASGLTLAVEDEAANKIQIDETGFQSYAGFQIFYWDEAQGKIWLQINALEEPFLYVSSLATGLGSNPVGLDRGQLGDSRIVRFRKVGTRVFLLQDNLKYRATTDSEAERRAIRESFAESILWSGEHRTNSQGNTMVDLTSFLLRDAHDCIGALARADKVLSRSM